MMYIVLFGILIVLANSIFYRQLSPSYMVTMFWSIQIIIALVIINDSFYGLDEALIWFWFVLFLCLLSGIIVKKNEKEAKTSFVLDIVKAKKGIAIQCLLAYACVVLNLNAHGFDFHSFFSLNSLAEANNEMAINRYSGAEEVSFLAQVLLMFVYSSCISAGYLMGFRSEKIIKLALIVMLPPVLIVFSLNTKAVFIICLIFLLSGYLVGIKCSKRFLKINVIQIVKLCVISIISIGILIFSMMLRIGSVDIATLEIVIQKFASYSLAHIPAFCYWFQNNTTMDYSLGMQTFLGPFSFFGIAERIMGVYSDYWSSGYLMTNVYSYFRGLIEDFGSIGGAVAFILIIIIGNYACNRCFMGNGNIIWIAILAFVYCFIFYWIISLCTYVSLMASFFVFFVFLKTSMVFCNAKR